MTLPEKLISKTEEKLTALYHSTLSSCLPWQLHNALGQSVMELIAPEWQACQEAQQAGRYACYLSAEYLMGRAVYNNLYSMDILTDCKRLFSEKGIDLAVMEDIEDAALGNGGLGRLAACFLDSAATHSIPLMGYGLRYQYGLFRQVFENGRQRELPDDWLTYGDPWSIRRDDLAVTVKMKGLTVRAVPYDMPVIGYGSKRSIGTLRLWQTESLQPIDFDLFNQQDYALAAAGKNPAEDIVKLLYPNDTLRAGRQLRVRQQYVLCSATLQDVLRNFEKRHGTDYTRFPDFTALQLNDTHPVMSIPELIRLLMEKGVEFDQALDIARRTFAYTNHTVMAEALEKWDIALLRSVAPEMTAIICRLAAKQKAELRKKHIQKGLENLLLLQGNTVHMAYLAMYGGNTVNGVAEIHTRILKADVLHDWYLLKPDMFRNETNGITPRRWLGLCNPELTGLIGQYVKTDFIRQAEGLKKLAPFIDDSMADAFIRVKQEKKKQLRACILAQEGIDIPESFVYDVQIKRLHEYKRQLLNAFSILAVYFGLKDGSIRDLPPTAFIFGAKSAPGYDRAKSIIYFINCIADMINNDTAMQDRLRVVFVHNYNCSYAEKIIPAADISEQISPAGTEASGTGNMKFMMNGAVTLGTRDGANIEIVQQAGEENNYIFGASLEDINRIKGTYCSREWYEKDPVLKKAVDMLLAFPDETGGLRELYTSLLEGASWHKPDHYYLFVDFESYLERKLQCIRDTQDRVAFAKKCLYNTAFSGHFSSDRTVKKYAREIWKIV